MRQEASDISVCDERCCFVISRYIIVFAPVTVIIMVMFIVSLISSNH